MQSQERNEGRQSRHLEEWQTRHPGYLSNLRDENLQNRQELESYKSRRADCSNSTNKPGPDGKIVIDAVDTFALAFMVLIEAHIWIKKPKDKPR
jgi:hypothetical protein